MSKITELENSMMEIERELDRIGAPKKQPSGYGYSPIGRLRALTQELVGEHYGATIDKLKAENAALRRAILGFQRMTGNYYFQEILRALDAGKEE